MKLLEVVTPPSIYHHGSLKDALGSKEFGTRLDGYDYFVNVDEEGIAKGANNKRDIKYLQILPR